jgi:DNA repair protein RadC
MIAYRNRKRHTTEIPVQIIDSPDKARNLLEPLFERTPIEVMYAIALNSSSEFLGFIRLSQGTVNKAAVYPRELLSFLLIEANATGVILAHNHPGGRAEASPEDVSVSDRISTLLAEIEVQLLDHLIYIPGRFDHPGAWISMREEGLI